jgi:hypothetical protein
MGSLVWFGTLCLHAGFIGVEGTRVASEDLSIWVGDQQTLLYVIISVNEDQIQIVEMQNMCIAGHPTRVLF